MTMDGLEGVVVAETCLSDVDGERGRSVIRGHDVEALAERADFEAACALLWTGELPGAIAHAELRGELGRARRSARSARLPGSGCALDRGRRHGGAARRARAGPRERDPGARAARRAHGCSSRGVRRGLGAQRRGSLRSRPTRRSGTPRTTCAWRARTAATRRAAARSTRTWSPRRTTA